MAHASIAEQSSSVVVTKNLATTLTRASPGKLNRALLQARGYGEAAIAQMEDGLPISYAEPGMADNEVIREYPDGHRELRAIDWLADRKAWRVETVKQLPDAPR